MKGYRVCSTLRRSFESPDFMLRAQCRQRLQAQGPRGLAWPLHGGGKAAAGSRGRDRRSGSLERLGNGDLMCVGFAPVVFFGDTSPSGPEPKEKITAHDKSSEAFKERRYPSEEK